METFGQYMSLVTKFGNANCILQYYGNFMECKRIMLRLGAGTKDQWESNVKAYRFGLIQGQREFSAKPSGGTFDEFLENVKSGKAYTSIDLEIEISTSSMTKSLLKFLDSVPDSEDIQINKITVPEDWYHCTPHLLEELFDVLRGYHIDITGVNSRTPISSVKVLPKPVCWLSHYILSRGVPPVERLGGAMIRYSSSYYHSHYKPENQLFEAFNLPAEELWINPFSYMEEFKFLEFHQNVLSSVKKIIVNCSGYKFKLKEDFNILGRLKEFTNLETIGYDFLPYWGILQLDNYVKKALEVSPSFGFYKFNAFSDFKTDSPSDCDSQKPIFEIGNATILKKGDKRMMIFKCSKFQFFDQNEKFPIYRYFDAIEFDKIGIQITNGIVVNILDIHDVTFIDGSDIKKHKKLIPFYRSDIVWVKKATIESFNINVENFIYFDLSKLYPVKFLNVLIDIKKETINKAFRLLEFVSKAVVKQKLKIQKHSISVVMDSMRYFSDYQYQLSIFRLIELPISHLTIEMNRTDLEKLEEKTLKKICKVIASNEYLKSLELKLKDSTEIGFKFRHLDLCTPNKDDVGRVQNAINDMFFTQEYNSENDRPKDKIVIFRNQ